jgi:hypothetical protein
LYKKKGKSFPLNFSYHNFAIIIVIKDSISFGQIITEQFLKEVIEQIRGENRHIRHRQYMNE